MRLLKVQGKGQVSVEPDMVTISFNVEANEIDYKDCLRVLNEETKDLRESMNASGLDTAQLKTSAFNVRVDTDYHKGEYIFMGYFASHSMEIELPMDKDLLNKVLRQVAQGHSGAEIRLSFSVKDRDALRKSVLTNAVQTAKENAETLASAAGMKLGKLMQMDYGWAEVRIFDQNADMVCDAIAGPSDLDIDIQPKDVSAKDNVTLVYEIAE